MESIFHKTETAETANDKNERIVGCRIVRLGTEHAGNVVKKDTRGVVFDVYDVKKDEVG